MSSFQCQHCNTAIIENETGKIAGCVLIKPQERYLKRVLRAFDGAVWIADDKQIKRIR